MSLFSIPLFALLLVVIVPVVLIVRLLVRNGDRASQTPADQRLAELWHKLEQTEQRLAALERKLTQTARAPRE